MSLALTPTEISRHGGCGTERKPSALGRDKLEIPILPIEAIVLAFVFCMAYFAIFGLIAANISKAFPSDVVATLIGGSFLAVGIGSSIGKLIAMTSGFETLFALTTGTSIHLADYQC